MDGADPEAARFALEAMPTERESITSLLQRELLLQGLAGREDDGRGDAGGEETLEKRVLNERRGGEEEDPRGQGTTNGAAVTSEVTPTTRRRLRRRRQGEDGHQRRRGADAEEDEEKGGDAAEEEEEEETALIDLPTPESLASLEQRPPPPPGTTTSAGASRRDEGDDDDRRRTLSPTKALQLFADARGAARRDTVSPEAIRTLLRDLDNNDDDDDDAAAAATNNAPRSGRGGGGPRHPKAQNDVVDMGALLEGVARTRAYLDSSKLLLEQTPTRRRRSGRRDRDRDRDRDSFTDALFSTNLLSRDDDDDDEDPEDTEGVESTRGPAPSPPPAPLRRETLEPLDAERMLSELRATEDDEPPAPAHTPSPRPRKTRRSSNGSNSSTRKRRTTLDPSDLVALRATAVPFEDKDAAVAARRRETIGDGDLSELQRELGLSTSSPSPADKRPRGGGPMAPAPTLREAKRARVDAEAPVDRTEDAVADAGTPENRRPQADAPAPVDPATDPLFSPPPTTNRSKTPLKSCLSAKKFRGPTTPNKSVNFGPPQGAQFNLGSPSTSMTPMCSREARAMFPLEERREEEEAEDDDDETSLNTSILDEADGRDSDEEREVAPTSHHPRPARESIDAPSSRASTRRRYSLRGVSPLVNQANARRQRRLSTVSGSTQASPAMPSRKQTPQSRNSFVSSTETIAPQSRLAYADSSASSDEDADDMEITGDFTNHAHTATMTMEQDRHQQPRQVPKDKATSPDVTRKTAPQDSLFIDSPFSDHTIELGTLKDLVDESTAYEDGTEKNAATGDEDVDMGTLGDLAREDEQEEPSLGSRKHASGFGALGGDQDNTLDPIPEDEDEDKRSSSAHSRMSVESDDSDDEYDEKRKSLVVNLSAKFERFGPSTPKQPDAANDPEIHADEAPAKVPSPPPKPVPLSFQEVLDRVALPRLDLDPVLVPTLELTGTATLADSCTLDTMPRICRTFTAELESWSAGLTDVLSSLLSDKAPEHFGEGNLDPPVLESIRALHDIESINVRSGCCQWRSKLTRKMCEALVASEEHFHRDKRALQSAVLEFEAERAKELQTMRTLIEREQQLSLAMDGIEEQQSVQREFESSVELLESQCAALALEESVSRQQLQAVSSSAPKVAHTEETSQRLRHEVLELEELLILREGIGSWHVVSAAASKFELVARLGDVYFTAEIRVTVQAAQADALFSVIVEPAFLNKKHSSGREDPVTRIVGIIVDAQFKGLDTTDLSKLELVRRLQSLQLTVCRLGQFMRDLRSVSTRFGLRFVTPDDTLWIDFIRHPRLEAGGVVEGVKFSLGYELDPSTWPHLSVDDVQVEIHAGSVTREKILQHVVSVGPATSARDRDASVMGLCRRIQQVFH